MALPPVLTALVRDSNRSSLTLLGGAGTVATLIGGGVSAYLVWYVARRAMNYGMFSLRVTEGIAGLAFGALLLLGLALLGSAFLTLRDLDNPGILGDPQKRIVDVRRWARRDGRFLVIKFENGAELSLKFTSLLPNEQAELAALNAVLALPQWKGSAPAAAPAPLRAAEARRNLDAMLASMPKPDEGKRTAVDAPFASILHAMREAGLKLESHMNEGVDLSPTPQNPIRADFATQGARALYFRSSKTGLQTVQVYGENAPNVFNDILNIGYLPVLQGKLPAMLESQDRAEVIRALGAIEFVHNGNPGNYYRAPMERLAQSPDPEIQLAAKRALGLVPREQY